MSRRTKKTSNKLPYFVKNREYLREIHIVDGDLDFIVCDLTACEFFRIFMNKESKEFLKCIINEIPNNISTLNDCSIMDYNIQRDSKTLEPLWNKMEGYHPIDLGFIYDYFNTREFNEDLGDLCFTLICEEIYFREQQIKYGLRSHYWGSLDEYK